MAVITKDREPIPESPCLELARLAVAVIPAAAADLDSRIPGRCPARRDPIGTPSPMGLTGVRAFARHLRGSQRTSSPALTLASVQTCSHRRYSDNGSDTESSSMVTRLESARRDPELRPGPARPWRVIKSFSRTALLRARRPRSPASPPPHSAQAAWQPARPAPAPPRPPATRPGQLAQHLAARRNPRPSRVPGRSC